MPSTVGGGDCGRSISLKGTALLVGASLLACLGSVAAKSLTAAAATVLPPGHDHPAQSGHPRLYFSATEAAAIRDRMDDANTLPNRFYSLFSNVTAAGDRDTTAALAQIHIDAATRYTCARDAINNCIGWIDAYDPPYPANGPSGTDEWWTRAMYRKIAITYDHCYDHLTPTGPDGHGGNTGERGKFQMEMEKICAHTQLILTEACGNHPIAWATGLGLCAMALEGDVPASRQLIDEPVGRSASTKDLLRYRTGFSVDRIGLVPGESRYVEGTDFAVEWAGWGVGYAISWLPGGSSPDRATNPVYYVTYTFTPDFPLWKEKARSMAIRSLDRCFADGVGMAGVGYAGWTLSWSVDLIEAMGRNMDFDLSTHPNVRDAVRWFPYELLQDVSTQPNGPNENAFTLKYRVNNRNDSNYNDFWKSGRAIPYLAWCTTRYAGDAEGRDRIAQWLLRKGSPSYSLGNTAPWPNATSIGTGIAIGWREAIWATGPWPMAADPMPASIPPSRFFRGMNLAAFRGTGWDAPNDDWSLFTLMGGPSALSLEHDQADKGSFTLRACGEDFAVDCGYGWNAPNASQTRAHNYLLIDGQDQDPASIGTSSETRSAFTSAFCDGMHADLRKSYVQIGRWMNPPSPWPMQRADRYAMFMKHAGRAPYVILSDLIDRDGNPHDYHWLMHTWGDHTELAPGSPPGTAPHDWGNWTNLWGSSEKAGIGLQPPDEASFKICGGQQNGMMTAYFTGASAPVISKELYAPREGAPADGNLSLIAYGLGTDGKHTRVKVSFTEVIDPKILAILVPERWSEPVESQLVVTRSGGADFAEATVALGSVRDLIVQNRTAGLAGVVAGDVETDAALAVVRVDGSNNVLGWALQNGTYLKHLGNVLWSATPVAARGGACWDGASLSVSGADEATEFSARAPGLSSFKCGDVTLGGSPSGSLLTWRGSARLLDVQPEGTSAVSVDFTNVAEPHWDIRPSRDVFCRVEGGAFCSPGLNESWISFTKRVSFDQPVSDPNWRIQQSARFADVQQWPRTHFRDAALSGTLTLHDDVDGADNLLRIGGRISDLAFFDTMQPLPTSDDSYADHLVQELVEARIRPGTGELSLVKLVGQTSTTLASASVAPLAVGSAHTYELSFLGDRVAFKLDGVEVLFYQGADTLPGKSGYFQWRAPVGMHVHLDEVRVDLPGRTVPAPSIVGITPSGGSWEGGTLVTIAGFDFQSGAAVQFGGQPATGVSVMNSNTIVCASPPGPAQAQNEVASIAGLVAVTVTNPDGQSGTRPGGFQYYANVILTPRVDAVSPSSGSTLGGTSVTVAGSDFQPGAAVFFGGVQASVSSVSETSIVCATPSHASGTVDVRVANPDGQSGTLAGGFTYIAPVKIVKKVRR